MIHKKENKSITSVEKNFMAYIYKYITMFILKIQ